MNRPNWYPTGTLPEPFLPVEYAPNPFGPGNVSGFLPPVEVIPEEVGDDYDPRYENWHKFFNALFMTGIEDDSLLLYAREGIDPAIAWEHLRAVIGSFQPKHEYKVAAFVFLGERWFERVEFKAKPYKMPVRT